MLIIATLIALVLVATAVLHLYWAMGGLWPGHSAASLVRIVVGVKGGMPPRLLTLAVALAIAAAGLWPLVFLGQIRLPIPPLVVLAGMWALCGVFLLRGGVTYLPGVWRLDETLPFYRLNRRWFSPLILAIGAGFLWLLLG